MSKYPDIKTQQQHRARLRKAYRANPENEAVRKALTKSVRANFIQQAAQQGVFICYAMSDDVFALDLTLQLRDAGVRAFFDELEADESMDWGDTVNQALRDCAVMVMILSPESLHDGEVRGEYKYFMNAGKIVVPVIAKPCDASSVGTMLKPINFATDGTQGINQLKQLLTHAETV